LGYDDDVAEVLSGEAIDCGAMVETIVRPAVS
jgi:hypothetical protein